MHTLAAAGEESRALAAAVGAELAPRTGATLDQLRASFPPDERAPAAEQPQPPQRLPHAPPSAELREQVEEEVLKLLRRPPRLTAPGLLGTRLEHLAAGADSGETRRLLSRVAARVAFGELPQDVLQALRSGELVALDKGGGEVRPLLVGASLRRLGLRALARARKTQLADAAGEHQYGVGRKGGATLLVKHLQALVETRPDATFIKVDVKAAFQRMRRGPAFQAMAAAVPEVAEVLQAWYAEPAEHYWRGANGQFETVWSRRGFDQGDPLSPAGFAVGQRQALEQLLARLQQRDPDARLFSYLDDTYMVVRADLGVLTLAGLNEALAPLGLELNARKTLV